MTQIVHILNRLKIVGAGKSLPSIRQVYRTACRFTSLRRFQHHQLEQSFQEVERVVEGLLGQSKQLEDKFLATTGSLMELEAEGGKFVKESERLVNLATGRADGSEIFLRTICVLDPPHQFLNNSHEQLSRLLCRLKEDNQRITNLVNGRDELERTMAPLKYIQTSFRIEAAPLGEEVQVMFLGLTQEIEKLHTQVRELFATKYEELLQIQRTISEVIKSLQTQTDNVWRDISQEKKQIDSTLTNLQRELMDNQKRESSIANLSGHLAQDIQKIVVGLQFQDIISQRLQHTVKDLSQIRERFDGSDEGIAFMARACRLEAEQIKSVRQDLGKAEHTVKHGIEDLLAQIAEADQNCVSLKEFENLTTSANGMVQVLLDVLKAVEKQVGITVIGCDQAYETLRPIGSAASDLTQEVKELSQRIHLIGLNAQVQASQVENGMGLEVLSARTSEISRDTNRISENMANQLDQLVAGLAESLRELEILHNSASEQKQALDTQGAKCENELHGLRDDALTALGVVSELLDGIRQQGQAVLSTATYVSTADHALADLQAKLEAVTAKSTSVLGKDKIFDDKLISEIRNDYTMASERAVFDASMGGAAAKDASKIGETSPDIASVELFDLGTVADSSDNKVFAQIDEAGLGKPQEKDGNVELF